MDVTAPVAAAGAAAAAAWLAVLAAVLLPVPDGWFRSLRAVGAATIAVLGLALAGWPASGVAPALVLAAGAGWALSPLAGRGAAGAAAARAARGAGR